MVFGIVWREGYPKKEDNILKMKIASENENELEQLWPKQSQADYKPIPLPVCAIFQPIYTV